MAILLGASGQPSLDASAAEALREILAAPPFGTTPADPDSGHLAALREALDYVGSRRLAADEVRPFDNLEALGQVDAALASVLNWHAALITLLVRLPPGHARNAALGDIRRGGLVTWATSVPSWRWEDDRFPTPSEPIRRADAELDVDEFPGLYDAILAWEPAARALIAIPTHRARVTWEPATNRPPAGRGWTVRLIGAMCHLRELIPLDREPSEFLTERRVRSASLAGVPQSGGGRSVLQS
jgi:hypothetical protein